MTLSRSSFAAALALAFTPAVALADQWDVTGKVEANPLRIETTFDTYKVTGPADLVARLSAVAGMDRQVTARVDSSAPGEGLFHKTYSVSVASMSGHATAPTGLLSEPRTGAATTGTVGPMDDVTIVGQSGDFLQVKLADGTTGYVPASFTAVGEDHTWARAIAHDLLGPIFASTSKANDARTFHPDGYYFAGTVTSLAPSGPLADVAQRLVGSAIVRPSLGAHKDGAPDSKIDIPGFTIRLTSPGAPMGANPNPGDENFTFLADLTSLGKLVVAPFTTNQFDYFDAKNTYYPGGVTYKVADPNGGAPRTVQLRVVPEPFTPADATLATPKNGEQRDAKLLAGINEHKAALRIEAQLDGGAWTPVARIAMDKQVAIDNEAFHYYPDLAGRGLVPQGTVNALRAELYPASQAARPQTAEERAADDAAKAAAAKAKEGKELEEKAGPRKGIVDEIRPVEGEK